MALPRAVAVVVVHDDRFLYIRRAEAPFEGWWSPITGRVEAGETLEAAAIREAREEMDIDVEVQGRCFYTCATLDGSHELNFFRARWLGRTPRPEAREVAEWGWFSRAELARLEPSFEQDFAAIELVEL